MTLGTRTEAAKVRRRQWRLWLLGLILVVLMMAVVAGAVWHWRLFLAERALRSVVESMDIELVSISVDRLDFSGAEVSDLQFGTSGAQRIAAAAVVWSLPDIFDRRLESIEISGADLQVAVGRGGAFSLVGLPPLARKAGAGTAFVFPANLPLERIAVSQSSVSVRLPDGSATVSLDAQLAALRDALTGEVTAQYSADTRRGRGAGHGSASFSWAQGRAPRGQFVLGFDRLVTATLTATRVRIAAATDRVPERLEDLSLHADAFAEMVRTPQVVARDLAATFDIADGLLDARGGARIFDLALAASTRLHAFDLSRPAAFQLKATGDATTLSERIGRVSTAGDIAIAIDGEIANPAELLAQRDAIAQAPARIADHITAKANLEADLRQFALADVVETGAVAATAAARWNGEFLDVDIGAPSRIAGISLASNLERRLVAWLPKPSPFDLAITQGMGSPPTARIRWSHENLEVRGIGGLKLALPQGAIALAADGSASATLSHGIQRYNIAALSAAFEAIPTRYGNASGDLLITDLAGSSEQVAGAVAGDLSVAAASARSISARRLAANFDAEVAASADDIHVALAPGSWLSTDDLRLRDEYRLPHATKLELAEGSHRLAFNRRTGEVSVAVEAEPGKALIARDSGTVRVAHKGVRVFGTWPGRLTVDAKNVSVAPDDDRSLELAALRLRATGTAADASVAITVVGAQPSLPGFTLPSFEATGILTRHRNLLDGELELVAAGGQPSLRARFEHDLESGRGAAEVLDAHLRFAPGVMQPGDLSPRLGQILDNVFATISLGGSLAWNGAGELAPKLEVKITDLAAATETFELFDASTSLLLTGLPLVATPPGQTFTGRVRVGRFAPVPFDLAFQLVPDPAANGPRLVVERMRAELPEGSLAADQFTLTPPDLDTDLTLRLEGAELARAFAVIGIGGIGGTGRIGGEIPLSVRGNRIAISGGRLVNDGPGNLFFDIAALPQSLIDRDDTVSLALRALSNFAYDELSLDIDKTLEGPGSVRLHMTGANPDVLDNYPFVFNISLASDFDRLAALVLEGLATSQGLLEALALSARESAAPVNPLP